MVAPNAHFGYYRDRTLDERLTEDVIRPAKAEGYEKIWLVGASMGALGSIFYLKQRPEHVNGILLIGPYLGDADIIEEISAAGGLRRWNPGPYDEEKDWQRGVWDFLKQCCANPAARAPIYLGLGRKDRYSDAQKLLAQELPEDRVIRVDGGHDAATFKKIWQIFLDREKLGSHTES